MEAGYSEKVDELCDRFSLQGFPKVVGRLANILKLFLLVNRSATDYPLVFCRT